MKDQPKQEELEVELGTKHLVEVSLYMYEQWKEAMKPPLIAYYDFPTWLHKLQAQLSNPTNRKGV